MKKSGFTLLEVLVALGIAVVIYLTFFRFVTFFLQTRGDHVVSQDIIVASDQIINRFNNVFQKASSITVSSDGYELRVTGSPCALIRYSAASKSVAYGEDSTTSCVPPTSAPINLTSAPITVTSFTFTPIPSPSAAKSVRLSFTVSSTRPFGQKSASFATANTLWKQ